MLDSQLEQMVKNVVGSINFLKANGVILSASFTGVKEVCLDSPEELPKTAEIYIEKSEFCSLDLYHYYVRYNGVNYTACELLL